MAVGVRVTTIERAGPVGTPRAPSGTYFVAGVTQRGPADRAVEIRSMTAYEREYGARVGYASTLYDDLTVFFAEGGERAIVCRAVGNAATTGTLTLLDAADPAGPTLRIDATGPGAWSSNMSVAVEAGASPGTVRVRVTGGAEDELYDSLASADAVVSALARSRYVRATSIGDGALPAPLGATPLSAGDDDRDTIDAAGYVGALDALATQAHGDGAAAVPGEHAGSVGPGLIAHAEARNRIALLSELPGADAVDARNALATLDSEYAGFFWPSLVVPDGLGGTRTITPTGYVAACRARAHGDVGPWRAPAGGIGNSRTLLSTDVEVDATTADELDEARVSVIRTIAGRPRLYGWRSLSLDTTNYRLLSGRDLLNRLQYDAEARLEPYVFGAIDTSGRLYAAIAADLLAMVQPIATAGGLYGLRGPDGELVDEGYRVDVSTDLNPPEVAALDTVNALVALRVAPAGALIALTLVKVAPTGAL
jgi:phage tail sheath protein FI